MINYFEANEGRNKKSEGRKCGFTTFLIFNYRIMRVLKSEFSKGRKGRKRS